MNRIGLTSVALILFGAVVQVGQAQEFRVVVPGDDKAPQPQVRQYQGLYQAKQKGEDRFEIVWDHKKSTNQEIVELLKKAIKLLEAQDGKKAGKPVDGWQIVPKTKESAELDRAKAYLLKMLELHEAKQANQTEKPKIIWDVAPGKKVSPEIQKARDEVAAAEQMLAKAKVKLAKLQAAPVVTPPADSTLEQRLDRLIQELEALRKEVKQGKPRQLPE
jgi:hypothetical protein